MKWQENNTKSQIIASLPDLSLFYDAREVLSLIELDLKNAKEEIAIYWSDEQIPPFFPLRFLKHCSNRGIRFFLSGIGSSEIAKELQNTQLCNTSPKSNTGLIGIERKKLWIYLNTTTASCIILKINSPQTIKLLYSFFSLIPHRDPGSKPEDLGKCPICRQPLWIQDEGLGSYLVCTKSIVHHKKKITAKNATTIARFMKITCGDCGNQVKGCRSTKNNSVFLACTNPKCKWTKFLKTII